MLYGTCRSFAVINPANGLPEIFWRTGAKT